MTPESPEPVMDRLLRRALTAERPVSGVCPDGELLAAWIDRALSATEAAAVDTHLASCARCQAIVAGVARSAPEPSSTSAWWSRWQLRWLVPVAAAATLAVWVAGRPASAPSLVTAPESIQAKAEGEASSAGPAATQPEPAVPASPPGNDRVQSFEVAPQASAPAASPPAPPAVLAPAPLAAARSAAVTAESVSAAPSAPLEVRSPSGRWRWRVTGGAAEVSSDGGDRWEAARFDAPSTIRAGSSPAEGVCWLAGEDGAVLVSDDGRSFRRVSAPVSAPVVSVVAEDGQSAVVATADGRRFATRDQGRTWTLAGP